MIIEWYGGKNILMNMDTGFLIGVILGQFACGSTFRIGSFLCGAEERSPRMGHRGAYLLYDWQPYMADFPFPDRCCFYHYHFT